jgi:hypothetical protein
MKHASTLFSTEILAGATISEVLYLAPVGVVRFDFAVVAVQVML